MNKAFVTALGAAFVLSMTVATDAATMTTKKHTTTTSAHSKCVAMHMGKSKTHTAMMKASKWCTAHHNTTKKMMM